MDVGKCRHSHNDRVLLESVSRRARPGKVGIHILKRYYLSTHLPGTFDYLGANIWVMSRTVKQITVKDLLGFT